MTLSEILQYFRKVKGSGTQYTALCPAHDDRSSSLSISEGSDGKILLHCHAGCSASNVIQSVGLSEKDLFNDKREVFSNKKEKRQPASKMRQVAEYLYTDIEGNTVHKTVRYEPKTFRQFRPDPDNSGKWISNLTGIKTVIYNLPLVSKAIKEGSPIYIVEGEKDCETLLKHGYVATTSPMGAGKWRPEYSDCLLDSVVYIVPDNDATGKQHALNVAKSLLNKAKEIKVLDLTKEFDGLKEKGDISDFLQVLGVEEGLKRLAHLIETTPKWESDKEQTKMSDLDDELNAIYKNTGYYAENCCLFKSMGEKEGKYLAGFVPIPTEVITKDDGAVMETLFKISAINQRGRTLRETQVPSRQFTSMNWITEAWGFEANYATGNTIKDNIRYAITSAGQAHATKRDIYAHTGWRKINGKYAFLYNGGAIGADNISVELESSLSRYSFPEAAEDYHTAAQASYNFLNIAPHSITFPLLATAYLCPLNEFFREAGEEPTYLLYLLGMTQARKTTLAALILCHFGIFTNENLPTSFKDTANSIEKKGFLLKDVLTVVDDYHPVSQKNEAQKMENTMQAISRAYGNRAGRGRLNSNAEIRETYIPRGNAIVTGEDIPNIAQSGLSRNLIVEVKKNDINLDLLTLSQQEAELLNLAMRGYIEWLIPQIEVLQGKLKGQFLELRHEIQKTEENARMSEVVAWLCIAFELFLEYMVANNVINQSESERLKDEAKSVFASIASEQSQRVEEEKPTAKFLNTLNELIQTNVCHVIDLKDIKGIAGAHNTGFIGYQDENFLYLHYAKTYKEIVQFYSQKGEQFPKSETMLLKELETEKLIDVELISNGRIQRTKMKSIAGKSMRLLYLYKSPINDNSKQKTPNQAEIIKPDFTKSSFRI